MSFRLHFQNTDHEEWVREEAERLTGERQEEFPATAKFEVTVSQNGEAYSTHLHVTGRHISINSTAESRELRETLGEAFEKAHRQLRKHHDKSIFGKRREGQKASRK